MVAPVGAIAAMAECFEQHVRYGRLARAVALGTRLGFVQASRRTSAPSAAKRLLRLHIGRHGLNFDWSQILDNAVHDGRRTG
jgi:hypothetical protein